MARISDRAWSHVALTAVERDRKRTSQYMSGVSAYCEIRGSRLPAQAHRRRPGDIVGAAMTQGAGRRAGAVAGVADGRIPRKRVRNTVDVQREIDDIQRRVGHIGVAFRAVQESDLDVKLMFPAQ